MSKVSPPGANVAAPVTPAQPQGNGAAADKTKKPPPTLISTRAAASRDARLVASGILEVLAGVQTPTEVAKALGLSVPRYYLLEQRALAGLVRACEPRPVGKVASERHHIAVLEKEIGHLRQECARQQALVRVARRTIALAASAPAAKSSAKTGEKTAAKPGSKHTEGKVRRKRRPVARALKAAATFREPIVEDAVDSSSPITEDVLQRSVPGSSPTAAESVPVAMLATV
jgi:hypothetical protein